MLSTLLGGAVLTGCSEENPKPTNGEGDQNPTSKNPTELYYANMFGKEAMSTYYYWNKEISSDLDNWNIETNNDPIGTVDRIRYHQGDKYTDKWSMLTDDMASFNSSVEGVSTTFGWNLTFYLVDKEKNQISLKQINKGNNVIVEVPFEFLNNENVSADYRQRLEAVYRSRGKACFKRGVEPCTKIPLY